MQRIRMAGLAIAIAAMLATPWPDWSVVNRVSLETVQWLTSGRGDEARLGERLERAESVDCRIIWQEFILARRQMNPAEQYAPLERALRCNRAYAGLLTAFAAGDERIAEMYVKLEPESYMAWYLYAQAAATRSQAEKEQYLKESLRLNPNFDAGWYELGIIDEQRQEFEQALSEYLKCTIIDNGYNDACYYNAGRMAEKLGEPQKAIEYYRMSRWEGALKRADELEAQLNGGR